MAEQLKSYIINLSGEDGATVQRSLNQQQFQFLKDIFEDLSDQCSYVSISIKECCEL